jgi:hypothetical protein
VKQIGPLAHMTQYYWRVRASNVAGASSFSNVDSFETVVALPEVPSLVRPPNGSLDKLTVLDLVWRSSDGAAGYYLQVSTDSLFATVVVNDSTIVDTMWVVSGLQPLAAYHWRVKTKNVMGWGAFSPRWKFTTIAASPAAPVVLWPQQNAKNQPTTVGLVWSRSNRASSYELQVSTDTFFLALLVNDSTLTDTVKQIGPLAHLTQYYWRVRASNVVGTSSFSNVDSFETVVALPEVPSLVRPLNGSVDKWTVLGSVDKMSLAWSRSNRASSYHLQLSADAFFLPLLVNDSTLTDTVKQIGPLAHMTQYYWRVRASNVAGTSSFSNVDSFVTIPPLPGPVQLVYPPDSARMSADSIRFFWNRGFPQVDRCWFELSTDSLFLSAIVDSFLVDTSKAISGFANDRTYWWRVRVGNVVGWGPFQSPRHFVVLRTGIQISGQIPTSYELKQNFPNPFNPHTTIRYGLPNRTNVTLTVFNTVGQQVAVLQNGEQDAGYHEVKFDGSVLSSGAYIYRIEAGEFVQTRKLLLLR